MSNKRVPRRRLAALFASVAALLLAVAGGAFLGTAPVTAATLPLAPAPVPLLYLQGFDFSTCTLVSSTASVPGVVAWQGEYALQAAANNESTHGAPPASGVTYKTCNVLGQTASQTYDIAAQALGAAISSLRYVDTTATSYVSNTGTGPAYTGPVNVLTYSLGGFVARRCLIQAARYPSDTTFAPCKRISNLVMVSPPSHGTMFSVEPPVVTSPASPTAPFTCTYSSYKNFYVTEADGCHVKTASACDASTLAASAAFSGAWSSACDATRPTSDSVQQESIGTGPLNVADEAPWRPNSPVYKGITHYYVFYSYSDEVVFLDGEQRPTPSVPFPPHSSTVAGAVNIAVPNMTHASMAETDYATPSTIDPQRLYATTTQIGSQLYVTTTKPATQKMPATSECTTEVSVLGADIALSKPFGPYITSYPITPASYNLSCDLSTESTLVP